MPKVAVLNPGPAVSGIPNNAITLNTQLSANFWTQIIAAAASGTPVLLPPGTVYITSAAPANLSGAGLFLYGQNTTLQWAGNGSPEVLFPCVNLAKFRSYGVTFDGGMTCNELISQGIVGSPGGSTPTQWTFKWGAFQNIAPDGILYHVLGADNCDGTLFEQMVFSPPNGGICFQSDNPNSLCNTFKHCNLGSGTIGNSGLTAIVINGGSFICEGTQFSNNSYSDIVINTQDGPCAIYGGWTQNSYRFVEIPYAAIPCNVTVSDVNTSSFPQNWVANGGSYLPNELTQTYAKYGTIYCNRQYGLMVNNCVLEDPIAAAPVYAVSARDPNSEALGWVRNNAFTLDNSFSTYIQTIWNQQGTIS